MNGIKTVPVDVNVVNNAAAFVAEVADVAVPALPALVANVAFATVPDTFTVTAPLLDNTVPIDAPEPSKIKVPADTVVPPV